MSTTALFAVLWLTACGGPDAPPARPAPAPQPRTPRPARPEPPAPARAARPTPADGAPDVIFVVLDTVRADHLSLCGYARPTSPHLARLARAPKASSTCDAYAPGTWTAPSHASYFTGLTVPEHGLMDPGTPLSSVHATLAEQLAGRGYETLLVSANPNLGDDLGLGRGFAHRRVAKGIEVFRGKELRRQVEQGLAEVAPGRPLFLFVNVIDAHDPYPAIPAGVDWAPSRPALSFDKHDADRDGPYYDYVGGKLTGPERDTFLAAVRDGYDYGVHLADQQLGAVIAALREAGRLDRPHRIVVTSDHGEFLGEHQLLRHGCYAWEGMSRVPLVFFDSAAEAPLALPTPLSALVAWHLALDGHLPTDAPSVASYSRVRRHDPRGCANMVALWPEEDVKWAWKDEAFLSIDLAADPAEERPVAVSKDGVEAGALAPMVRAFRASVKAQVGQDADPAVLERLRKLGYVE